MSQAIAMAMPAPKAGPLSWTEANFRHCRGEEFSAPSHGEEAAEAAWKRTPPARPVTQFSNSEGGKAAQRRLLVCASKPCMEMRGESVICARGYDEYSDFWPQWQR